METILMSVVRMAALTARDAEAIWCAIPDAVDHRRFALSVVP
jgi:hypothetical protein